MFCTLNFATIAAHNGASVFECWAIVPGFATSSEAGIAGADILQLGNLANATFVAFMSGLAHVTLPNSTADAWIAGGEQGLILAVDTASVSTYGHNALSPDSHG
ncbi:hypothetical protein BV25DRAFT_1914449 [Artomyces pyxidatus]|uniref:Uncharacterized protein n=1 Tax=Artomyces pyxidatus TaxID=48021 RepID=A0ACB8T6A4_9AGAM|nr:hypothetical protein BV25DRAFT_1914449 [Artomyces pyxidatus]